MGKLANLNIPVREGNLRNLERLNQSLKDVGQKAEPWKRLATEGFGQVLLGDEGTIPWYMSFAPGADLTDKLMEGRQPGLLDIPGPGTLAKIAMLPIMKLGAKEILEGTARMGKNTRNLNKAKNPVIERWHRTRSINDANIRDKGLLVGKDNPNYGKNTGDHDQLKIPAAWLGTSPTEVPVLQYYFMNKPGKVSTYRVRIPKEEYYSTPRLKWDSGYRGNASDARIVAKGESSLTGEVGRRTGRESLIDLFGKSIPPEYLEQVSPSEMKNLISKSNEQQELNRTFRFLHGRDATSQELHSFRENLDKKLTYDERQPHFVGDIDEAVKDAIRDMGYTKYDMYPVPPNKALNDALRVNRIGISNTMPYGATFADILNDWSKGVINVGDDISLSEGAISRGNKFGYKFPHTSDRQYNWSKFKNLTEQQGLSPAEAHQQAMPVTAVDWENGSYTRLNTPHLRNVFDELIESPQRGAISRAMDDHTIPTVKALRMIEDKYPRLPDAKWTSSVNSDLESVINMSDNPSALVEAIATAKGGTLAKMRGPLKNISFYTKPGKIRSVESGPYDKNRLSAYEYLKYFFKGDKEKIREAMRGSIRQNVKEVKPLTYPHSLEDYVE